MPSKQLNVSSAAVRRIAALVDPSKVGSSLTASMAFNVEHGGLELCTQELSDQREVVWASSATGQFSLLCVASFRSTDHLADFIQMKWSDVKAAKDIEVFLSLQVKKGRFRQI